MQRSYCTTPWSLSRSAIKDRWYASWDGVVSKGMRVQVSYCLWGLWRKAQRTSWSCLIKALTGPDYMSQPGGGVCVSFLRWRKSIWWERGGAVPVGVRFCMDANTHLVEQTPLPLSPLHPPARSTQNKHPHPSHLPDHTRASRRHKYSLHKSCQIDILLPDYVQKRLPQNLFFSVLSVSLNLVQLQIAVLFCAYRYLGILTRYR